MVDVNDDEKKRREIGLKFKNDQLNDPAEIEYFLEQFKDDQYAFNDEELLKVAEMVQKNPDKESKAGVFRNFFTIGRRTQKALNIQKQMQKITKLESKRNYDKVAVSLKYDGLPVTAEGKKRLQDTIGEIKGNIDELDSKIGDKWYSNPILKSRRRKAKRDLNKIDPAAQEAKRARLKERANAFKNKSSLEHRSGSTLSSLYYSARASLAERKLNKMDASNISKKKAEAQSQKVQQLEANVAGSKFYQNMGDKFKLGFARFKNNRLQKKIVKNSLGNDLLASKNGLASEIEALSNQPVITKTDKKRRDAALAEKMKLQAKIEKRLEKLDAKKSRKEDKIEAQFSKKEDKAMAVITGKSLGIEKKNKKLESHTTEGRVRKKLMTQVSDEKREQLEGILNAKSEKAITADADFKKYLEKAGFKESEIEKLQGIVDSYTEKKSKSSKTADSKEGSNENAESSSSEQIIVNEKTTVNEYKKIIEEDAKKTVILDKSMSAEMKARCMIAALSVEDAQIKNMPMIKELKDKGANVAELEAAKEKSMKEKAAALTPDRRKELRELSVASKAMKMDEATYKAFKESDLKTATPEQLKLLDNMRLPKDSEAYNKLSPEDKSKVEKASKDVDSLNKNKERNKILSARGVVTGKSTAGGKKPSKQKVVANQRIIKENQAQLQFR